MMFGYATNETDTFMPMSLQFAHNLVKELARIRKTTSLMPWLRPDSKSQVTVEYNAENRPARIHTIVLSTQHDEDVSQENIRSDIEKFLIPKSIPGELIDSNTILHVNPTGNFVIGGPHGDTGLTGRKIIVDTYGGRGAHGGGAFSGKDASKVDRSAAYAARHIAKNIVAAGLAEECLVQLAYAIGIAKPVSIAVNTFGTSAMSNSTLVEIIEALFDCTPAGIIDRFGLKKPQFRQTAAYGHFGRNGFPWEELDMVDALKQAVGTH